MSRRKSHRRSKVYGRNGVTVRSDTPSEMQSASLSSPFFREAWSASSKVTWQQFVARWENRFIAPRRPPGGR